MQTSAAFEIAPVAHCAAPARTTRPRSADDASAAAAATRKPPLGLRAAGPAVSLALLVALASPALGKHPDGDKGHGAPPAVQCGRPPASDGDACDDGNPCTQTDTCSGGVCLGGNPKLCAPRDQCHIAGTCDPQTGSCSNPPKRNGSSCDDGDRCTQTDSCQAGVCAGADPVACTASDQCHLAGRCDPATGRCSNPGKPDDSPCSDGNACTLADTCQDGACSPGRPKACQALDQCHAAGTCDPASGACSNPPKPDETACNDGNGCTLGDVCRGGSCRAGAPKTCRALDQCHVPGTCSPATGSCSNPPKSDGAACDDGSVCTRRDACQAGVCTGAEPVVCTVRDQCQVPGACDPRTGLCSDPQRASGTPCNDGDPCTLDDICQTGACRPGRPKACQALDQCHDAGTCDPASGVCSDPAKPDGVACDDADLCTTIDRCVGGVCLGSPLDCDDGIGCTDDPCREGLCEHVPRDDRCAAGDSCAAVVCRPDFPLADVSTGCALGRARPDGDACEEDRDPCTDDRCRRGVCTHDDVRNRPSCDPVTGAYSRALDLLDASTALEAAIAASLTDGGTIGARSQLAGGLAGFAGDLEAVVRTLSGRATVDDAGEAVATGRARAALEIASALPPRVRTMLGVLRSARRAEEVPRGSARQLTREVRSLLAGSRALERTLRQIQRVSRLLARGLER